MMVMEKGGGIGWVGVYSGLDNVDYFHLIFLPEGYTEPCFSTSLPQHHEHWMTWEAEE
jgi:hypothetical protein